MSGRRTVSVPAAGGITGGEGRLTCRRAGVILEKAFPATPGPYVAAADRGLPIWG